MWDNLDLPASAAPKYKLGESAAKTCIAPRNSSMPSNVYVHLFRHTACGDVVLAART